MTTHRLVGDCARVVRDQEGKPKGVIVECICGWKSGGHFSGMGASAAFQDHKDNTKEDDR